jgi:hypothetical protein
MQSKADNAAIIDEAWHRASEQNRQSGLYIGERRTPCISFWPMMKKWEKYGKWFTYTGTDGNTEMRRHSEVTYDPNGKPCRMLTHPHLHTPAMIQLFYVKLSPAWVMQLAWLRPDLEFGKASIDIHSDGMSINFHL